MGDYRDQPAHLALDLGHRLDQAWRAGGLGNADVEADVGEAVVLEILRRRHPVDQIVESLEVGCPPAFRRQQHGAGLDSNPVIEGRPGRLREARLAAGRQRRLNGDKCPPAPAAPLSEVAALLQGRERLAQGGA